MEETNKAVALVVKTKKRFQITLKPLRYVGWLTGFEPATLGTTNQYSNQLSYNHHLFNECKDIVKVGFCK